MTATQDIVRSHQRLQWMDALRVIVIAGVIVMHATTAYLGGAEWYYMERTTSTSWSTVPVVAASFGALFGLAPLFLVSGWLSARSLARKGPAAFARGRLVRLGVPLIVFIYLIDPISAWLGGVAQHRSRSLSYYLDPWEAEAGPMWFVAALLVFSLVLAAARAGRHRGAPAPERRPPVSGSELSAAALTIGVTGLLAWQFWPLDTGDTWLNLRWGLWPQGAVLFALGVRAAGSGGFGQLAPPLVHRLGWIALMALTLLAALATVVVAGGDSGAPANNTGWLLAALAVLYGTISVSGTWWLVDHLGSCWTATSDLLTAAGRASYATYVLHPLTLTAIMVAFAPIALAPEAKCGLVAVAAVPVCFMIGYGLTRVPGLSRIV